MISIHTIEYIIWSNEIFYYQIRLLSIMSCQDVDNRGSPQHPDFRCSDKHLILYQPTLYMFCLFQVVLLKCPNYRKPNVHTPCVFVCLTLLQLTWKSLSRLLSANHLLSIWPIVVKLSNSIYLIEIWPVSVSINFLEFAILFKSPPLHIYSMIF